MNIIARNQEAVPSVATDHDADGAEPRKPEQDRLPANTDGARWQCDVRQALRDAPSLLQFVGVPHEIPAADAGFPVFVPRPFARRIERGNPRDPLLLQVLPRTEESQESEGFILDPVGDRRATRHPGVLQKYAHRTLLITTGTCAVHCRYCFRRHFPYDERPGGWDAWQSAFDLLTEDTELEEVILSGGDPLMHTDVWLAEMVQRLATVPHLRRLRIHTRLPIMIPQRVTRTLVEMLAETRLQPILVVHANHANELDDAVFAALRRLSQAGIPLLNQAVLLAGVNDSVAAQVALCTALVDHGVLPYYLHQLRSRPRCRSF